MLPDLLPAIVAAITAAILMPLAIRASGFGQDDDFGGVQKVHVTPTSRLGGVVVVVAYTVASGFAARFATSELPAGFPLLFCAIPVILVGLSEDVTRGIHPWHRLAAAVGSAAVASFFANGIIARVDLPVLDVWLRYLPFALPLTWFMVAGACNAMNLIDGAHGLAGGIALMMFGGLALLAAHTDDTLVLAQALAIAGAVAGFMVWNYPRGKVFLGDAGAYFLGFMYAQLSIAIVARNDDISAWSVIALAAYPIVETLYSIYRRKRVHRTASMQPDAAHMHSLIFRRLALRARSLPRTEALRRANARVAPWLWLHGAICAAAVFLLHHSTPALIGFTLLYAAWYVVSYRALADSQERAANPASVARVERSETRGR